MQSAPNAQNSSRRFSIGPPMPSDWHGQAVCMFFYDFVITSKDATTDVGYLQILPDLWNKDFNTPACQEAVSAVALMYLAHRSSLDNLVFQARHHYGTALRLIAGALSSQEELKKDSTLAAILCAGLYEVCIRLHRIWTSS